MTDNCFVDDPVLVHCSSEADDNETIGRVSSRKRVSFDDDVTDIDSTLHPPAEEVDKEEEDLSDILNISEKIDFFRRAFEAPNKSLGHQTSIPEARLAFVTGMVESPSAGNQSRADKRRVETASANVARKDGEDMEPTKKGCYVLSVEVPAAPDAPKTQRIAEMATTQLTYSKIFAPMKPKNGTLEAVVDTSSILEHREELRDLWEKRMMADENQPSSSSTVPETTSPKPLVEGENEEEVSETKSESETNTQHKMANGYAKHVDNNNAEEDTNANHIHEETTSKEVAQVASSDHSLEPEHENNNSADSLEEDNTDDYVEEKTYTSRLDQALVMKKTDEVVTEAVVSTSTVEEVSVSEEAVQKESVAEENVSTTTEECNGEVLEPAATPQEAAVKLEEQVSSTEDATIEKEMMEISSEQVIVHEEVITSTSISEVTHQEQEVKETFMEIQMKTSEAEKIVHEDDDDDGYVRVEECLPQVDSTDDLQPRPESASEQNIVEEHEVTTTNGYEEHPPSPAALSESAQEDKSPQPEMEQFVKSGGVKRILPGVQKTEQPYSSCTTETKIAMEIREMREREEELRMMREQALLSPVVSPVPPKSPVGRSPSPCLKEMHSPTPQGPGYRVSSVFGHKGTTSPSPPVFADDDKKPFKGFSKESAVEKEIRLARDREEELRKQKGLPPREDDSYVKPSQVKSSQVRVFGKIATANNASVKQAATAKIQMEIEEQTQREMALRESGHIQTISQERTDAKVAKLKNSESPQTNGTSHALANGNYSNGRASPDVGGAYKRSSPSPTGARPASIFSQSNAVPKGNISMHKFIASKGKETTFSAPRNGGPFQPKEETKSAVPPPMVKLKRNLSVESKIQQEILEMKQREEELKKLHMNRTNENFEMEGNGIDLEMNQKNNLIEYENGNGVMEEEISPRHNKLIAQWEQRIQKAES